VTFTQSATPNSSGQQRYGHSHAPWPYQRDHR
jgi:hypothetical protein